MSFVNAFIEIRLGNVESSLVGPVPRQFLDRALNAHLRFRGGDEEDPQGRNIPLVFNPVRDSFLTGALPTIKQLLRGRGYLYRIRDQRTRASSIPAWRLKGAVLRDYQKEVVEEAVRRGRGLIDIGTGGGKTMLAAAIVARLGVPTLWLVTTRVLLEQTRRHLFELLGQEPGIIGGGVRRPDRLTVALIQSFDAGNGDLSIWSSGTLVFDEGHHAAASTYQEMIRRLSPRFQFYLSAVPFRSGSDQAILDALAGRPLTGGKYSARFLIEHGYACPVVVRIERGRITGPMSEKPFSTIYKEYIVENAERNEKIASFAKEETENGHSVLVLVDWIEHGSEIKRRIGRRCDFAHGKISGRKLRAATDRFASGRLKCLIATSGLFQEGVNISGIHVLIAAGGLKSKARVVQSIGRGMRLAPGKRGCLYIDFWDDDSAGVLRSHSKKRLQILKEMGFNVPSLSETVRPVFEAKIPAQWSHVSETTRFLKIDGDGDVLETATCLRPQLVPGRLCKKCERKVQCSRKGGKNGEKARIKDDADGAGEGRFAQ